MSKAFTRESDDAPDPRLPARVSSPLPPGAKNYVTPNGERLLREELDRLLEGEQKALVQANDNADACRQLQTLRQRIQQLQQSLQSAVIVSPPPLPWDQVRFGATVTVRDRTGNLSRYRVVGVDETDLDRDWISWCSPLARALLNARLGQRVRFRAPGGEQELEIIEIRYE